MWTFLAIFLSVCVYVSAPSISIILTLVYWCCTELIFKRGRSVETVEAVINGMSFSDQWDEVTKSDKLRMPWRIAVHVFWPIFIPQIVATIRLIQSVLLEETTPWTRRY